MSQCLEFNAASGRGSMGTIISASGSTDRNSSSVCRSVSMVKGPVGAVKLRLKRLRCREGPARARYHNRGSPSQNILST